MAPKYLEPRYHQVQFTVTFKVSDLLGSRESRTITATGLAAAAATLVTVTTLPAATAVTAAGLALDTKYVPEPPVTTA